MKKQRLVTLMSLALLTSLCACNQQTTPPPTPGNAPPPAPAAQKKGAMDQMMAPMKEMMGDDKGQAPAPAAPPAGAAPGPRQTQ
jgi:hypothetical protein